MQAIQEIESNITIGQIVADNFRTADVFKKYNIDFCCKGGRLLKDVCRDKNLDIETIERELAARYTQSGSASTVDFNEMPLDELAHYIQATHHSYVREHVPTILAYLTKVNKVHGANHPELNEILMQFANCAEELLHHMAKEETILFPAIQSLAASQRSSEPIPVLFPLGTLSNPVNEMQEEHITEGNRVARIAELTNGFTPPEDACTTYKVAYMKLEEFVNDLFTHIHLENNILFPKALELETAIAQPSCKLR